MDKGKIRFDFSFQVRAFLPSNRRGKEQWHWHGDSRPRRLPVPLAASRHPAVAAIGAVTPHSTLPGRATAAGDREKPPARCQGWGGGGQAGSPLGGGTVAVAVLHLLAGHHSRFGEDSPGPGSSSVQG